MGNRLDDQSSNSRLSRRKRKTGHKKWRKFAVVAACIIGVLLAGSGAYAYHIYHSVQTAANKMYHPVNHEKSAAKPAKTKPVKSKKDGHARPISILLMGVDQRPHDVGRSDTLIVLTLNPKNNKMQMISIPRDTRVEIPGHGMQKINAAYAYGGPGLTMKTVRNFLDVPLDYYIRINMQGLEELVDAVGGIKVYNTLSWHDEGYYKKGYFYHKGWLHMNGPQTLGFVRMRHQDPRGDFGRNQRQRKVIQAIVDKASGVSSFSHYQDILDAISNNVITDMTFSDMKYVAMNYRDCRKHIKSYEVDGTPQRIDGLSYVVVSDEEVNKVHNMILDQLGHPQEVNKGSGSGHSTENAASAQ
ncbi:MAG TPA: LCP family protein [Bacillales bacterium]|nr:LCP family protein [Bacillales bacterium]